MARLVVNTEHYSGSAGQGGDKSAVSTELNTVDRAEEEGGQTELSHVGELIADIVPLFSLQSTVR